MLAAHAIPTFAYTAFAFMSVRFLCLWPTVMGVINLSIFLLAILSDRLLKDWRAVALQIISIVNIINWQSVTKKREISRFDPNVIFINKPYT